MTDRLQAVQLPGLATALEFVRRRSADCLLFAVTAAALFLLFRLTPAFGIVAGLYVLQHLMVLSFALIRDQPHAVDHSASSNAAVAIAYLYPYAQVLCLSSWPSRAMWPEAGLGVVTLAALFSILCLVTMGKRFGVRPAARGLVTRGPYRLVRHPLYLSYLVADIGYNMELSNSLALSFVLLGWTATLYRIRAEERVLSADSAWPAYARAVCYRLVPGIW